MSILEIRPPKSLPTAKKFHESEARVRYLQGGLNCGKTTAAIWESIFQSRFPKNRVLHVRKTYASMRNSILPSFYRNVPTQMLDGEYNNRDHTQKLINGSVICFGGMDTPAQRENYRSSEFGTIIMHECSEFYWEDYLILFARSGRIRNCRGGMILESNPPDINHWLYNMFEKEHKGDVDYAYWKMPSKENQANHTDPLYIANIESQYRGNPNLIRKYLDGEWGADLSGTPVFLFNPMRHSTKDIVFQKGRRIYRGWDLGYHHPAVVWFQVDSLERVNVLRAHLGDGVYMDKFADTIIRITNEFFPGAETMDFADIEGLAVSAQSRKTEYDILKEKGIRPMSRRSLVKEGIAQIQKFLNTTTGDRPNVQFHSEDCEELIRGMNSGYCWKKFSNGMIAEEPNKDGHYDHLVDALRYGFINLFGVLNAKMDEERKKKYRLPHNWQIR